MGKRILKWICAGLCGFLAACAIITVNVYFPEKDVKQAYKSLDEMLLKQDGEKSPDQQGQPPVEQKREDVKPQSRLFGGPFSLSLVAEASAQDKVADDLAVELSSMPEVLKAYDEVKASLPQMNALRDIGAVGENKQGLLTIRDATKLGGKERLVKAVNESRKVIITGMAKAILKINKQPVTDKGIKQILPKAAATFADIRHEGAKPGWWVELANGKWIQK